jgi:hypothetical protein
MKLIVRDIVAALLLFAFPTLMGAAELQVTWDAVPKPLVEGRKVEVQLAGGGRVTGNAISVGPDGLQMAIEKASPKDGKYQRGEAKIDRVDILALKCRKSHVRGRIIGTIAGGAMAGTYAGLSVWTSSGEDIGGKLTAASIGLVAGGYMAGWLLDRSDVTTIHILARDQQPARK